MKLHDKVFVLVTLLAQVAGLVACFDTKVQTVAICLTLFCVAVLALFIAYRFRVVCYFQGRYY